MILKTENYRKFFSAMSEIEKGLSDGRPNMGLVYGEYGRGKTYILSRYSMMASMRANVRLVYLRVLSSLSSNSLMDELLNLCSLDNTGRRVDKHKRLCADLLENQTIFLLDEVNLIVNNEKCMEMLRDIHDDSNNTAFVLCGTDLLNLKIRRYGSLYDRLRIKVPFNKLDYKDVGLFAKELCVCEFDEAVLREIALKNSSIRHITLELERVDKKVVSNSQNRLVDMKTYKSLGGVR